jgi:hypothetical protein
MIHELTMTVGNWCHDTDGGKQKYLVSVTLSTINTCEICVGKVTCDFTVGFMYIY